MELNIPSIGEGCSSLPGPSKTPSNVFECESSEAWLIHNFFAGG